MQRTVAARLPGTENPRLSTGAIEIVAERIIDRLLMLFADVSNIREVIAFPKTQGAQDLLLGAPSPVDEKQLKELHLRPRNA